MLCKKGLNNMEKKKIAKLFRSKRNSTRKQKPYDWISIYVNIILCGITMSLLSLSLLGLLIAK